MGRHSDNRFRLIAGDFRHRQLTFPDAPGLRPTPDRVRETLFNWLQMDIAGARCLDLFAGSGALTFEALSRGAASVTAVELAQQAASSLRKNADLLQVTSRCDIVHEDALAWLERSQGKTFDLIFLDPPYSLSLLPALVQRLAAAKLVAARGLVYLEDRNPLEALGLPPGWSLYRSRKAGQVHYGLCRYTA